MKVVQRERGNINTHLRYMSDVYAKEVKKLEILFLHICTEYHVRKMNPKQLRNCIRKL